MIWAAFFIALVYVWSIVLLYIGYDRVPYFPSVGNTAATKFSVLIPFRNEAQNLPRLLRTLQQLHYPKSHFEIIFINDGSTDISEELILQHLKESNLIFQILQNTPHQPSPKKAAITLAISTAKHPWIVTTDADCSVLENWLQILNDFILSNAPVCVAMPVAYEVNNSFLQRYQQLDNWSLQAVTVGSFGLGNLLLSNGANFAYSKEAFTSVNGFEDNAHIASGDDMFLLEKYKQHFPKKIGYLKSSDAVVTTQVVDSWKKIISQRVRWASKTSQQKSIVSKLLGILVFAMNLLILLALITLLFWPQYVLFSIALICFKLTIDFILLRKSARFFKKSFPFFSFLGSTFIYPIVTVVVVISSIQGTYVWKERLFKTQEKQHLKNK
ncbi:glycosyltransferase [Rasiella sp. SM2506]|uniref:glycosyltransferase n=1 Tax=Rasiella sp. SM2506 TaxID=3423914 RepID=UPI003D797CBC